jgi:hypothetical protein
VISAVQLSWSITSPTKLIKRLVTFFQRLLDGLSLTSIVDARLREAVLSYASS